MESEQEQYQLEHEQQHQNNLYNVSNGMINSNMTTFKTSSNGLP